LVFLGVCPVIGSFIIPPVVPLSRKTMTLKDKLPFKAHNAEKVVGYLHDTLNVEVVVVSDWLNEQEGFGGTALIGEVEAETDDAVLYHPLETAYGLVISENENDTRANQWVPKSQIEERVDANEL